jgi:hypothetical protein
MTTIFDYNSILLYIGMRFENIYFSHAKGNEKRLNENEKFKNSGLRSCRSSNGSDE